MARDVRDVWAYRDRMRTRQDEQRPGMFRGTNYVSGAQLEAEDAQRRELEMQRLKNTGQLDVADRQQTGGLAIADRQQTGATTRTGMTEGGALQRLGMTEGGLNQRFGQELQQRRNESDEDFWLRREELEKQNKQFQATHSLARDRLGYEQGIAEDTNRLRLFEHLNQTNPLTGQSNFELNRDRYNLYSMTPEAQAALNERILGNLDVAGDARVTTSGVTRPDISGEVGGRQYTDAQNAAASSAIGTNLGRTDSTRQMQNIMRSGPGTSILDRSPGWQRTKRGLGQLAENVMITPSEYDRRNRY